MTIVGACLCGNAVLGKVEAPESIDEHIETLGNLKDDVSRTTSRAVSRVGC